MPAKLDLLILVKDMARLLTRICRESDAAVAQTNAPRLPHINRQYEQAQKLIRRAKRV